VLLTVVDLINVISLSGTVPFGLCHVHV